MNTDSAQSTLVPALGLLGGTFDPIHFGHLRLAEEATETLGLARVRLIPAGIPPHRAAPGSSSAHRLAMTELAAAGNSRLEVDASEVRCDDKSYTVLTLERLRRELGAAQPLVLILGADAFAGLHRWHRWEEVLELAHVAVANRPGHALFSATDRSTLPAPLAATCGKHLCADAARLQTDAAGCILPFTITALDISATLIRSLISARRSVRYLLPDSVVDYISRHQLYR